MILRFIVATIKPYAFVTYLYKGTLISHICTYINKECFERQQHEKHKGIQYYLPIFILIKDRFVKWDFSGFRLVLFMSFSIYVIFNLTSIKLFPVLKMSNFVDTLSSPLVFKEVGVSQSSAPCVVLCWRLFVLFLWSLHCLSSLDLPFWLPFWYLRNFLRNMIG